MSAFRGFVSTYHQKNKFPVGSRVGEVKGDQLSSRKCYAETVKVEKKRTRMEEKGEVFCVGKVHKAVEEEQEEVMVVPGKTGKTTKARDLDPSTRSHLMKCLGTMQTSLIGPSRSWWESFPAFPSIN